jgi:succinoglycan biosynthesis protein ExoA
MLDGSGTFDLPPLGERPRCTIVIPCYNEERFIEAAVRGAMAQTYPRDLVEILVVDGRSTDKTRALVAALTLEDPRVALHDNPGRYQSAAMNIGIKRSRGDVIVRMDAHAEYAEDYVERSVEVLRRTGAANVGGAARPRARGFFQHALSAALGSPLGVGGSAYRDETREGFVESVFNGAFRREAFQLAGLYDPKSVTNEDAELNQRIIEAGGKVYLSRDIVVHYYPRDSLGALARQYFAYGQGRARTLYKRGRILSMRPLVPFATLTGFAVLAGASVLAPAVSPLLTAACILYGLLVVAEAVRVASRTHVAFALAIAAIFPVMHAAHGAGFWAGLVRHVRARWSENEPERLTAR